MKIWLGQILVTIVLFCVPADVWAYRLGLLLMDNQRQMVDLSYRYYGSQVKNRSSDQQHLYEAYSYHMDYGVYKPQFLRGHLSLGVRFDQSIVSSTGSTGSTDTGMSFMYDIDGIFLNMKPTPVDFLVQSKIEEVPSSFGPGYEIKSDTYGVGVAIKNRFLPLYARYSKTTNETDGLENDRVQTHDVFSLSGNHAYKNHSNTLFSLVGYRDKSTSIFGTDNTDTSNYDFLTENTLKWGKTRNDHSLRSWIRYSEQSGDNDYKSFSWSESLQSYLGKALRTGLIYSYDKRNNRLSESDTSTGRAWIEHRLFNSLTTHLEVLGRRDTSLFGSEQQIVGRGGLNYTKKITPQSRLQLALFESYGITDRNLGNGIQTRFDEEHRIDLYQINLFIVLDDQDVIPETIIVRNQNPLRRPTPYVSGVDFIFDTIGGRKGIRLIGIDFRDNDLLLVTYDTIRSPQVKYSTDSHGIAADLTTSEGKYHYYASWQGTRQGVISGRSDQINLINDLNIYILGFETLFSSGSFSTEYNRLDSDDENHQSIKGTVRHRGQARGGTYTLYLSDIYTTTKPSSTRAGASSGKSENIFNAGGFYSRLILRNILMIENADYSHVSGDEKRDDLASGLALRWHRGLLSLTLQAQVFLRESQGTFRQEERLRINLTRYF